MSKFYDLKSFNVKLGSCGMDENSVDHLHIRQQAHTVSRWHRIVYDRILNHPDGPFSLMAFLL
jgi:hypothetical protein